MLIRPHSDLHLEFAPILRMIELETDKDTVLVLAGDVCAVSLWDRIGEPFFKMVASQFKHVIYVFGNHEFYSGGSFLYSRQKFKDALMKAGITNVYLLEKETMVIDDVAFVGATLWTDFKRGNPGVMAMSKVYMADYSQTYFDGPPSQGWPVAPDWRGLRPQDVYRDHADAKDYVFSAVKEQKQLGRKVVLVVHHGVSEQSVHRRFKGNHMNPAFVSELDAEIIDAQPDILVHGHVHNVFNYKIGNTQVIVNPRAYPNEHFDWDEALVVEL